MRTIRGRTGRKLSGRARVVSACAAALALAVPAFLAVPAAQAQDEEKKEKGEKLKPADEGVSRLVVATSQPIENWNPFNSFYVIEYQTWQLHHEQLITNGAEDYSMVGRLAEEWEQSEDGKVWTFKLRDNAKWHDGEPVTAEDVAYTYHIIMNDPAISDANARLVELLDSVEATDEHTVVFTANEPIIPDLLNAIIVPKHVWEQWDGNWGEAANDEFPLIGSGPFQVVEYQTDQFIRFKAFDDYWDGRPEFDEYVFRYYTEPDAAVAALEAGEVDVVTALNVQQFQALEGQEGISVNAAPNRRWIALRFNTGAQTRDGTEFGEGHPALKDPVVRQAMHWAIDKEQLVEKVASGYADPATSIVPKIFNTIWWEPTPEEKVEFDIDKANQMLDDAGYEMGDDGVRVSPDGDPLKFVFGVDADSQEREHISDFLVEWWADIGIEVERKFDDDPHELFYAGKRDFTLTGWGINPNPTENLERQICDRLPADAEEPSSDSDAFFCNEEYDALNAQQQKETDPDKRADLLKEMQRILYTEAPKIYLYYPNVMEAYRSDRVEGFLTQPADGGMITGQIGPWAMHSADPIGGAGGGVSMGVLIGAGAVVVIAGAAVGLVLVRRRQTAGERE